MLVTMPVYVFSLHSMFWILNVAAICAGNERFESSVWS